MSSFISAIVMAIVQNWYFGFIVSMLVWTVPESPRWVLANKGEDAGHQILQRVAMLQLS